jgi:hypothetical protein
MKIAVIDTGLDGALPGEARAFLPKLLEGLTGKGIEAHLIRKDAPAENIYAQIEQSNPLLHISLLRLDGLVEETAPVAADWLSELNPDVYLIWTADDTGWAVLPRLNPTIATLTVGHADSEIYYVPTRHYRPFLTRVVGTTPEVCVGFVLGCVLDKERVEWISYGELEGINAESAEEEIQKIIETYHSCFEKAIEDAHAAPRATVADFPPLKTSAPASRSWFSKLKAKILN